MNRIGVIRMPAQGRFAHPPDPCTLDLPGVNSFRKFAEHEPRHSLGLAGVVVTRLGLIGTPKLTLYLVLGYRGAAE